MIQLHFYSNFAGRLVLGGGTHSWWTVDTYPIESIKEFEQVSQKWKNYLGELLKKGYWGIIFHIFHITLMNSWAAFNEDLILKIQYDCFLLLNCRYIFCFPYRRRWVTDICQILPFSQMLRPNTDIGQTSCIRYSTISKKSILRACIQWWVTVCRLPLTPNGYMPNMKNEMLIDGVVVYFPTYRRSCGTAVGLEQAIVCWHAHHYRFH